MRNRDMAHKMQVHELRRPHREQADQHWLTPQRVVIYPTLIIIAYLILFWLLLHESRGLLDKDGRPLFNDFLTFWTASWLALAGDPLAVFDPMRMLAAERIVIPGSDAKLYWHYPPSFLLIVLPLSLLPYPVAWFAWMMPMLGAYLWMIWRLAPRPATVLVTLAFTGTLINFIGGQNGFLSAALLGGAVLTLRSHPIAAGILFGLLTYKPQLALLVPIALVWGRHWTAFVSAGLSAAALAILSGLVFGWSLWGAFLSNLSFATHLLDAGRLPWSQLPSVYVSARSLGLDRSTAYAVHGAVAVVVARIVARTYRQATLRRASAVFVSGSVLVPPYLFDYDLVVLAIPMAIVAWDAIETRWLKWEREILLISWIAPRMIQFSGSYFDVQLAPLITIALFAICVRRAFAFQSEPMMISTPSGGSCATRPSL
jgi:hypothetical protein